MKLRQNAKYAIVTPTSMGVRITPEDRQPVHTARQFTLQVTSAESNVLTVPASLGMPVKVLTAFVAGSPIARIIKDDLASRHIDYEGPEVPQGGPWGYRHQFNIADSGFGIRGPRVHNDRAGEVGRTLDVKDFDIPRIFGADGAKMLHISGLVAALSPQTSEFCLALVRAAKKHDTRVSFDLNYRASFWKGRKEELSKAFAEMADAADILVGNEEDFQLCLGLQGPEAGGKDLSAKLSSFQAMIDSVRRQYANASVFATTLREVENANLHHWGAILLADGQWHIAEPRPIPVLDRIGGGDGFVGGLLYGILQGWDSEKCLHFGWATGALTVTTAQDYALIADEEQVWSAWEGNARVKR